MPPRLFAPLDDTRLPLALPPVVPDPAPPGFPYLAAVAPVAGAVVLWLVTGSMLSLGFAVLGPVLAVATVLDGRRQARRAVAKARRERDAAFARLRHEVDLRHGIEAEAAWLRHPSSSVLVARGESPEWRGEGVGPVVLGGATIESTLRVEGTPTDDLDRAALDHARRLAEAPVVVELEGGLGIAGPVPLVHAAARAVLVQCAHLARPDAVAFEASGAPPWRWLAELPHAGAAARVGLLDLTRAPGPATALAAASRQAARPGKAQAVPIVLARHAEQLPPGLALVVRIDGPRTATLLQRGDPNGTALVPDLLAAEAATAWTASAAEYAERAGLGIRPADLPAVVPVRDLPVPAEPVRRRTTLRVPVGAQAAGPLELDLVAGGPHAIVAGTTGSGKSEFLLAWIVQMAAVHPPERVAFLLVDFKGGAAFEPVASLPHVAGIVTDLDDAEAERAVQSLTAELRHRERMLRDAKVRDIADLPDDAPLARLVVVIDEFQAMILRFRELGAVVADIAARGRSLGVHLVLASQRPNGVLGEQVTANAPIRVSLRVMNRSDSLAVVGTDDAACIPSDRPGRGIIDPGDGVARPFQSALVDAAVVDDVRRRYGSSPPVRRPWLDPLPARLAPAALDAARRTEAGRTEAGRSEAGSAGAGSAGARSGAGAPAPGAPGSPGRRVPIGRAGFRAAFGLLDEPDLQRRSIADWSSEDGHLLVLGAPGSGRSTALAAIEGEVRAQSGDGAVLRLGGDRADDWRRLAELVEAARGGALEPRLLVVDDLDTRLLSWPEEYRHAAASMLAELLRDGRRHGLSVAAAAVLGHRLPGGLRDLFGPLVHLRHPSRAELAHAGGLGDLWQRDAAPGSGQWRARRLQVVDVPPGRHRVVADEPSALDLGGGFVALVSTSAQRDLATLRARGRTPIRLVPGGEREVLPHIHGRGPALVIGDAEAWSASFALAARARDAATIVVRGGLREFRALAPAAAGRTGPIPLPPLLRDDDLECWVANPGEAAVRRRWSTTENTADHGDGH